MCARSSFGLVKRAQSSRIASEFAHSIGGRSTDIRHRLAMGYIRDMWLRSTLTSLLAAIMLCVSCFASTCALKCEICGLQPIGNAVSDHSSAAMDEAVLDHCGHVAASPAKSEMSRARRGIQIGQPCESKLCTHVQVPALNNVAYQLHQPAAVITTAVLGSGGHIVVRLPNHGVSDLLPKPPPKYFDVLRL
jgi:hypothetical protein